MKYIASVRDKETRKLMVIEKEYPTKKAFESDLRGNGFSIRFIATEETFDEACEKWHDYNERSKRYHKQVYTSDKKHATRLGMSIAEYRTWLNA